MIFYLDNNMNKPYRMRFPSQEGKKWMREMLSKYIREKFNVVYWNNKPNIALFMRDELFYKEGRSRYYINAHLAGVIGIYNKLSTKENPLGVSVHVYKKLFNEWLKTNAIDKPKFLKTKLT